MKYLFTEFFQLTFNYINVGIQLDYKNNNQKLYIFKRKIKTMQNIISLSNISAVTFQQPFSMNKVD